jgi:sugar-phosphatase
VATVAPRLDAQQERARLDGLLASQEHRVAAMPGADVLLYSLEIRPWAIVTSGSRRVTFDRFRRIGLPVPQVAVCGEDVLLGKPHPEGYLRASTALGIPPAQCVVVEDAPAGIAAGRAAGCLVVALTTTHHPADCRAADEILADLTELRAWLNEALTR